MRGETEVRFKDLPEIHAGSDTQGVQHDVDRTAIREVRHILHRPNLGDYALVPVSAGELVARTDLPELRYLDLDLFDDARLELVALVAREDLDADDMNDIFDGLPSEEMFESTTLNELFDNRKDINEFARRIDMLQRISMIEAFGKSFEINNWISGRRRID